MPECKNCKASNATKSGFVRGKQRYRCRECGCHFVRGDARTNTQIASKKALCVLFYCLGKTSFNMLGHLLDIWPSQVYRWVSAVGATAPDPAVSGEIKEMEFDEMWHFLKKKRENTGSSRPWTVAHGEPWPGCSVTVTLQRSGGFMRK